MAAPAADRAVSGSTPGRLACLGRLRLESLRRLQFVGERSDLLDRRRQILGALRLLAWRRGRLGRGAPACCAAAATLLDRRFGLPSSTRESRRLPSRISSLPSRPPPCPFPPISRLAGDGLVLLHLGGGSAISSRSRAHGDDLVLDGLHRVLDALGVLGGSRARLRMSVDTTAEALAELAGPRRLDRAVDRQHVGLDRHRGDGVHDLVDAPADLLQRRDLLAALRPGLTEASRPRSTIGRRWRLSPAGSHDRLALLQRRWSESSADWYAPLLDLGDGGAGLLRGGGLLLRALADLLQRGR